MRVNSWFIWVSFIVAMLLDLLPWPGWGVWLRPDWVFLCLIFWALMAPSRISVGWAFLIGLFLDLLNGTALGAHALAMVPVVFLINKFHKQINMFPTMQLTFLVLFFVLIYKFIIFLVQGALGQMPHSLLYWLAALVDAILWPWLYILMRDLKLRFCSE